MSLDVDGRVAQQLEMWASTKSKLLILAMLATIDAKCRKDGADGYFLTDINIQIADTM